MRKVIHLQRHHNSIDKDYYVCTKTENNLRLKVGEAVGEGMVVDLINTDYQVIITQHKK